MHAAAPFMAVHGAVFTYISNRCLEAYWMLFLSRRSLTGAMQALSDKKLIVKNLFLSDIPEEFIAMQLDLDIPTVVSILKEMNAYRAESITA